MREITKLLDELSFQIDSAENRRRASLWEQKQPGIRSETQWHGVPNYTVASGKPMPVTVECQDRIWQEKFGFLNARYFTDPEYYLEYYLRMRVAKFKEFSDDTPLTRDIPVCFGVTHEAGIMGQKIFLDHGEEPTFSKEQYITDDYDFSIPIDLNENAFVKMAVKFYEKIKSLVGNEFNVIFPIWYRDPRGSHYIREDSKNFSMDLYINEDFVHRLLRYITDTTKAFMTWRSRYLDEPVPKGDLFNDDIPLMSPEAYEKFFFQYEQELADFYGGIYYWHSCGDITKHVPAILKLNTIDLFDFGVSMEDKLAGIKSIQSDKQVLELRVFAKPHVQDCSEEESRDYVRRIIEECVAEGVERYIIRSSGMSRFFGADEDIRKLAAWVDIVREVQESINVV